ncbi:phosphoenolpyruvate carboxylase [Accumulibacter sp.]|uniref:phosphoenolpyruvate carboxylase n=1 Tax=Accumulibacter sp. TaxID=2053492 RepID=UPI00258372E3|nr:phosphoenolpyruvate carboxylase [Accumulibacter sp.]
MKRFLGEDWQLPPFFRVGSWIGGDRDGNPFVTADILENHATLAIDGCARFLSREIHALGAELPLAVAAPGIAGTGGPCREFARPFAAPCRRALSSCADRHLCRLVGHRKTLARSA